MESYVYDFKGKVVLITGGTRGIGKSCAQHFSKAGATVAICGRALETAQQAATQIGGNTHGFAASIGDSAAADALIKDVTEKFGPISVLVNNAGITKDGLVLRMKDDDWDAVLRTNLTGAFHCCRAAARGMIKQRHGRIINISSIIGLRGQAGQCNYAAAKAGLIGFSKSLAQELGSRNVTVNVVAPGYIDTDMTAAIPEDMKNAIVKNVPLGRTGSGDDVAGAVCFLASDAAAYITGAVLTVDGGLAM
jgi:3-oxoacyl-[acyl-carrier protein] reductase